jgi:putative oxidoreductase
MTTSVAHRQPPAVCARRFVVPEGLFVIRVALGLLLFAHGTQKLFGWFGGYGVDATGGFFESLGHRPGRRMATLAGLSEAGGGALLVLGLLTPLAAAMAMGVMVVAAVSAHAQNGLWNSDGGYELPLTNGLVAAGLAFTGAGNWSLDHALGWGLSGWGWGLLAVVVAMLASTVQLARRSSAVDGTAAADDAYPAEVTSTEDTRVTG